MSRRSSPLVGNLTLAVASALAVLVFLEVALRVIGFAPPIATRRMVDARWTRLLDCYPTNPRGYFDIDLREPGSRDLYYEIAPRRFDDIARYHPWAVESRYNDLRFRELPPAPAAPGKRRVVVFGDSFTEGQGVKANETVSRVLEEILEEQAPGRYEVRNCGRRGLDLPALYGGFEASLAYEPDLVVYALVLNDAVRSPEFQARQSYIDDWILDREHLPEEEEETGSPWRPRLLEFVTGRIESWRVGRATARWYLDMWGDGNPEGWARTQEYIREMDRRLNRRAARFLVAPWPLFVGLESSYPFRPVHETIERFCLSSGIAHHDLLPAFEGRKSAELWVHPVDRHPNEIAHRIAAESLAPVVRRLLED